MGHIYIHLLWVERQISGQGELGCSEASTGLYFLYTNPEHVKEMYSSSGNVVVG